MDPTIARLVGVLIGRLLVDGWTSAQISEWTHRLAQEIGRPGDSDVLPCRLCGQLIAE